MSAKKPTAAAKPTTAKTAVKPTTAKKPAAKPATAKKPAAKPTTAKKPAAKPATAKTAMSPTTARTSTEAATRTHPRLWAAIYARWLAGDVGGLAGKWNARKAQLAVVEYKKRAALLGDSGYTTAAAAPDNSLNRWTREDWGYAGEPGRSRPRYVGGPEQRA